MTHDLKKHARLIAMPENEETLEVCIECNNASDDINTEGFCATCADWFVEGIE